MYFFELRSWTWPRTLWYVNDYVAMTDLKRALQTQEEETMAREKDKEELEEKLDAVKSELSKTEQARKDLLHKVLYSYYTIPSTATYCLPFPAWFAVTNMSGVRNWARISTPKALAAVWRNSIQAWTLYRVCAHLSRKVPLYTSLVTCHTL